MRQSASLSVRLFGPLDVQVNGGPLPHLRTRKVGWTLALLVLRHGKSVERDWLAGTLWPDSGASQAHYNLREGLTELRHALGTQAWRIQSPTPHTLCLDLSGAQVDLVAFDEAIASGAPPSLERAVALYRGPLLEGCMEEWVLLERQAREQGYLAARERLAALALEQGEAGEAERHLRLAVAADPLQESTQRALMQVLAAGGNYAAALLCYRELRLLLHRELNTEPDPETQTLFQQLRSEARRLAAKGAMGPGTRAVGGGDGETGQHVERVSLASSGTPVPSSPPPTPTGVGTRRVPGLVAPSPLRSRTAPPHNLPRPLTSFVGREKELAEVKELLSRTALLTLTGSGGCGKTRLALQVAAEVLEEYPDGAWLVELAALTAPTSSGYPALVPQTVAIALGVREQPNRPLLATLAEYLRPKALLLVLDNCEHLLPACAQLVEHLLRGCPKLQILATSREGLGIAGEMAFRVPSLSLPPMVHGRWLMVDGPVKSKAGLPSSEPSTINYQLSTLLESEAVRLFVERAGFSQPGFALTPQNAPAVVQICQRLDGIPLAIELAAARVKAMPVEQIASRLDDRFRLLTGGSRTAPPRHQTLGGLIDWSYELLSEAERVLLQRLSIFSGGWTLEAAEGVCSDFGFWILD